MRRLLTLLALLVLAALGWWLSRPAVTLDDLGPAVRIVTRPGVPLVVVSDLASSWRALPQSARSPRAGYPLPDGLRGIPCLDSRGRVVALYAQGIVRLKDGALDDQLPLPEAITATEAPEGGHQIVLMGVDAQDEPVLLWRSPAGLRLFVHATITDRWRLIADGEGRPAEPLDGTLKQLVLSDSRRALAFPGVDGWEVWLYDTTPVRRRVAEGCRGARAVFTPEGDALVLDGKVKGLWRLGLDDESLRFMAEGNLGHHEKVPFSYGFRDIETPEGPATVLLVPQYDLHDYLQIGQTHLTGGGRWSFEGGSYHHYSPALGPHGNLLAYVQSDLEGAGHDEEIYLFDFQRPDRSALLLARRRGGRPGQGPAFVGDGSVLMFIAGGRLRRLEIDESL